MFVNRGVFVLATVFALVFCRHGGIVSADESRWALLVGIDRYQNADIAPLSGAVADARAVADALKRYCGFPEERVFLLTSDDPANRPTLGNIYARLEYVASRARPGDVFMFYFSGHGITRKGKSYLLTWESDINIPGLIERLSLPVEELNDYLSRIPASKVFIVMDACRDNPDAGRGRENNVLTEDFARGIRVEPSRTGGEITLSAKIYSCGVGQRAYEWPGRRRGFFSVAFQEALSGKAAGEDGVVTLDRLESYVHWRVPELVERNLGPGKSQVPWVDRSGAGAGEFVWSSFAVPEGGGGVKRPGLPPVGSVEVPGPAPVAPLERVSVGGSPPTVRLTETPSEEITLLTASNVSFRFEGTDDVGITGYRYRLDDGPVEETRRGRVTLRDVPSGVHTFQVQASDAEGNYSEPARFTFTVLANMPPAVEITAPPEGARVVGNGLRVRLGGSDEDGRITAWRCGVDDPGRMAEQDEPVFVFEELVDGTHTVFVQAVDDRGGVSAVATRKITYSYSPMPPIDMVSIPSGSFRMGDIQGSGDDDERPVHEVRISAFEMSAYEITQGQYEAVIGENPATGCGVTYDYPVNVNWYDAVKFCNKLSELCGLEKCYDEVSGKCDFGRNGFRLPTEAEWEYACRAGTETKYYTGNSESDLSRAGWYWDNSGGHTHPVGLKEPNAWGLYDMHGNVWEWCNDWYSWGYYSVSPSSDPTGPPSGFARVVRGGSWSRYARNFRSALRRGVTPSDTIYDLGFRVVRRP